MMMTGASGDQAQQPVGGTAVNTQGGCSRLAAEHVPGWHHHMGPKQKQQQRLQVNCVRIV